MSQLGVYIGKDQLRHDINSLLDKLSFSKKIVIFTTSNLARVVEEKICNKKVEIRIADEKPNFKNKLWQNLFRYFGYLPKHINTFYIIGLFRINNQSHGLKKLWSRIQFQLILHLPKYMHFDTYINRIDSKVFEVDLEGIDNMLFFTEISSQIFLSKCLNETINIFCYVYSWDHPPKFRTFSKHISYFTWNKCISIDLMDSWGIDESKILDLGSTQFTYIHNYLKIKEKSYSCKPYAYDYIYFVCSTAYTLLVKQEVTYVGRISKIIEESNLPYRIVFRPYPNLKNWDFYSPLRKLNNVVFDDDFRSNHYLISEEKIYDRYWKIDHSLALIHFGTTLGLEACFFNSPSLIVDIAETSNLLNQFVHQYQNEKYLLLKGYDNVIQSENQLKDILLNLKNKRLKLLSYNKSVIDKFRLRSVDEIANGILSVLSNTS